MALKIVVAGAGYVGLSNAVLLAQNYPVWLLDIDQGKIDAIRAGRSPIADELIQEFLDGGKLKLTATTDVQLAYTGANLIIVATPTDYKAETDSFDTDSIHAVLAAVRRYAPEAVVIIRSTVPIGFTKRTLDQAGGQKLLFSPEFLREGRALYDNLHPTRLIVGIPPSVPPLREDARRYAEIVSGCIADADVPLLFMSSTEAEAVKLFANTYLALRVAFFNELDTFADIKGLDTASIIEGVCLDPRIGKHYNNPSFGYGGYCLPKDTKQLLADYRDLPSNLIEATIRANGTRKRHITKQILATQPETVGIYLLTAKQDSDNYRQSSVLDIIGHLTEEGVSVLIYEPRLNTGAEDEGERMRGKEGEGVDKNSGGGSFLGCPVVNNLTEFKESADIIVANRYHPELDDVKYKVYTRDLYHRD